MPKKVAGKKSVEKKSGKSSATKSAKGAGKKTRKPLAPSEKRFVRDVLIRGEAVQPTPSGELPPGATHRIVEDDEEGLPVIERERFSLY